MVPVRRTVLTLNTVGVAGRNSGADTLNLQATILITVGQYASLHHSRDSLIGNSICDSHWPSRNDPSCFVTAVHSVGHNAGDTVAVRTQKSCAWDEICILVDASAAHKVEATR